MKRLLLISALSAGVLAMGACGPTQIDMAKVQTEIESKAAAQTGATVTSVSCPTGKVEAQTGATFTCTVQFQGINKPVNALITQDDDKGNVTWQLDGKLVPTDKVVDSIKSGVSEQAGTAPQSVTCPPKALQKSGYTFECTLVTSDAVTYKVTATVDNDEGDTSWKVGQPVT